MSKFVIADGREPWTYIEVEKSLLGNRVALRSRCEPEETLAILEPFAARALADALRFYADQAEVQND